ncbi:MAG: preprotein translocase subunit SecG [Minisyncoccota bacterium]
MNDCKPMANILPYIQIILSFLLIGGVLLQQSEAGLGSAFGSGDLGGTKHTRRGFEKLLFVGTIIVSVLFALTAFANLLLIR